MGLDRLRERIAAMPRGAKIAGGVAAALAVGVGGWRLLSSVGSDDHHTRAGRRGPPPPAPDQPSAGGGAGVPGAAPPPIGGTEVVTRIVEVPRHLHRHHPLGPLILPPARRPTHPEIDLAVRRDILRLLEDVERARGVAEPPLAGAALTVGLTLAGLALAGAGAIIVAKASAKTGFELGAYVAEALMARGIVAQMPHVPRVSAITPDMTEKDGQAAFKTLVSSVDGPMDSRALDALRELRESSGITFWAIPGTDAKIASKVAEVKARKAGGAP